MDRTVRGLGIFLLPKWDARTLTSLLTSLDTCREAGIERALDKMAADWEGLAFELGPWRETGTFILKSERSGRD